MRLRYYRRALFLPFLASIATMFFVFLSLQTFSVVRVTPYYQGIFMGNFSCDQTQSTKNGTIVTSNMNVQLRNITKPPEIPMIYVITPTYKRPEQIPEITRLGQTLMLVPRVHWIVADDALEKNKLVQEYLDQMGMPYTYLLTPMPERFRNKKGAKPKGVANRNGAVDWIRNHSTEGVLYFADDDNSYDIRIFEEIRSTREVSMFPVGLVTSRSLSTPVLRNGRFEGWYDGWMGGRKFPVDMAGFAVSVQYLLKHPKATMPYSPGYEEDGFLKSLQVEIKNLEFLASNCTKVYVWHTRTHKNALADPVLLDPRYNNTNLQVLKKSLLLKPRATPRAS
ncbi:galactosylgalactosylxylosylprotein 3-beta-glucuronosyltransferase P-like isoform X2 [Oratosquilla oratoria]|uniref:galactosylgalactosylxylosylprotein 3-beta-glucuronosyltransferase P-like isoform X2 n=1 Tax=Oratosquilla oratoria TaxID=337810 RepID=UPI003F76363A